MSKSSCIRTGFLLLLSALLVLAIAAPLASASTKPLVAGAEITESTKTGFTLNTKIHPGGLQTTYQVEYGETTSYGSKAPVIPGKIGANNSWTSVSIPLSGLKIEKTYYYRIVATNSDGSSDVVDSYYLTTWGPDWTLEGETLHTPEVLQLSGGEIGFNIPSWGTSLSCPASAEAVLSPGSKGTIEGFEVDPEACQLTGLLAKCTLESYKDEGPWILRTTINGEVEIEGTFRVDFDMDCPIASRIVVNELVASPDDQSAMSIWDIKGTQFANGMALGYQALFSLSPEGLFGISLV